MWKDMLVGGCFLRSHYVEGDGGGKQFSKEPL